MRSGTEKAALLNKIKAPEKVAPSDQLLQAREEKELFDIQVEKDQSRHTNHLTVLSIWVLGIAGLVLLLLRMYHFLTPLSWQWLNADQIQTLDKLLFSGTLGSILGKYGGSVFSKANS